MTDGERWFQRFLEVTKDMTYARKREVLEAMKAAHDRGETAQDRMRAWGAPTEAEVVRKMQNGVRSEGAYNCAWGADIGRRPDVEVHITLDASGFTETVRNMSSAFDGFAETMKRAAEHVNCRSTFTPEPVRQVSPMPTESMREQFDIKRVFWPTLEQRCAKMRSTFAEQNVWDYALRRGPYDRGKRHERNAHDAPAL